MTKKVLEMTVSGYAERGQRSIWMDRVDDDMLKKEVNVETTADRME